MNDGPGVVIKSVEAVFPCDDGLKPYVARYVANDALGRYASESYCIPIHADLRLPPGTQTFHFIIQSEFNGKVYSTKIDPVNHFDFRPRPGTTGVFISHKIPEDTLLAEDLARYLARAGFESYLAEHDKRPGISLWEKIAPEIDKAAIVAALGTQRAAASRFMSREIKRARDKGTPVYLAVEPGAKKPPGTPSDKEWDEFDAPLDREAMAIIAGRILENERRGHYRAANSRASV